MDTSLLRPQYGCVANAWATSSFINEDAERARRCSRRCAPIPAHLENLRFDSIRHIASASFEIACNVKILLDAFLETYHLKSIHPQTVDRFLDSRGTHAGVLAQRQLDDVHAASAAGLARPRRGGHARGGRRSRAIFAQQNPVVSCSTRTS